VPKSTPIKNLDISVVGLGYAGASLAILLSRQFFVKVFDIDLTKLSKIENRDFTFVDDPKIKQITHKKSLSLKSVFSESEIYSSNIIFLCLPTNLNQEKKEFDTLLIEEYVKKISLHASNAIIVIKSTVPIGFTQSLIKKYKNNKIIFSPEFLQEGRSVKDNLYPSRIVIGGKDSQAMEMIANLINSLSVKKNVNTLFMAPAEAESVKLFSNMYLATRIAFFNELDTFAMNKKLDSASIIRGVSLDKRIGNFYNNPSFGFGGYCLPKDAMQLESDFGDIPNDLISSVLISNKIRKSEIVDYVRKKNITKLGIYKIENKLNSDNFRYSVMLDLISSLQEFNISVFIFDKSLKVDEFQNCKVYSSLTIFKNESEIILANRMSKELLDVKDKVFSRDIFNRN